MRDNSSKVSFEGIIEARYPSPELEPDPDPKKHRQRTPSSKRPCKKHVELVNIKEQHALRTLQFWKAESMAFELPSLPVIVAGGSGTRC